MAVDDEGAGPIRQPDSKALQLLTEMYWSAAGWRTDPEAHVTPEDFSYASEQGLLFEPRHLTHDQAVEGAIAAHGSLTARQVAMAFAYSLPTRRLDLRSALGSYASMIHLQSHAFTPWAGRGPTCEICGFYRHFDVDFNVLSFERFKFGGVRHHHIDYAAFDLGQLRLWFNDVEEVETGTLHQVLERWRALPTSARARHAADSVRGLVPSNDAERRTLVEVVGIAGVLHPSSLGSMIDGYVPDVERNDALLTHSDWGYPVCRWMGHDGVNESAVAHWWSPELARLDAAAPHLHSPDHPQTPKAPSRTRAVSRPKPAEKAREIDYPFVPKSNAYLVPGQFWGIPLSDGRYACGRVLDIDRDAAYGRRTSFLAGLMDWCGDTPPTAERIAGMRILEQGEAHIKTILENGGEILGCRRLEADGLAPLLCLSAQYGGDLQLGLKVLRAATREEQERLAPLAGWGYKVISIAAEQHFVLRRPPRRQRLA